MSERSKNLSSEIMSTIIKPDNRLLDDIRLLIDQSKHQILRKVNSDMTILYWQIGCRINEEVLKSERAEYGEQIIKSLAVTLSAQYGKGFTWTALMRIIQFSQYFSDPQIVATVSQQLSWSHIVELLPIEDSRAREFYAYMIT